MDLGNRTGLAGLTALAALGLARPVHAGVEAWRINEIGADPRFVELYAPPSAIADNCFFPTTRLEILDGAGGVIATVQPFSSTTCYGGDTYFTFAPAGGDAALPYPIAAAGGQVCFRSSTIRHDCVRWGAVTVAVGDQSAPADASAAAAPGTGNALARVSDTGVVATDFVLQTPTPRGPNDGSPWFPPDAGPPPPDAAPVPDGFPVVDAEVDSDAPPQLPNPDARSEPPAFLDAEPGGGGCGCALAGRRGGRGGGGAVPGALGLALLRRRARRGRVGPGLRDAAS